MNDEWSRCPICFEDYSSTHRPTTFECGHSTCINHVTGRDSIQLCPICRFTLRRSQLYQVSFNLLEAANLFQLVKNKIDWSTIHPSPVEVRDAAQTEAAEALKRDEVFARQLQAELNNSATNRTPQRTAATARAIAAPVPLNPPLPSPQPPTNNRTGPHTNMKSCGHSCDLRTTTQCCACSDRRPNTPNQRYPVYADGRQMVSTNRRDLWYCPACKHR